MYQSWILLAVPLFILAAEVMNSGTMTERLLRFCEAMVGRFRGGLAQVNVVQSIIFAGMSGSAIADAAGSGRMMQNMMTRDGKYTAELRRGADGRLLGHRADHPAVDPARALRARLGCLDRLPVHRRHRPRPAARARADDGRRHHRRGAGISRSKPPVRFARDAAASRCSAFPALMMPVVLLGGMRGGVMTPTEASAVAALYALRGLGGALSQPDARADSTMRSWRAPARPPRSAC